MTGTKQRKLYQAAKSMEKRLAALEALLQIVGGDKLIIPFC